MEAAANNPTNNYIHYSGDNYFNVVYHVREAEPPAPIRHLGFNFPPPPPQSHDDQSDHRHIRLSYRQAIYAFTLTVSLTLVQIKYQGQVESPFETRPKTMFLLIASLLLYHCVSFYVTLRRTPLLSTPSPNRYSYRAYFYYFSRTILRFCGPMSLACVTSLILPESLSPSVFSMSVLFSLSQILVLSHFKTMWGMVKKVAIFTKGKFRGKPPQSQPAPRTSGRGRGRLQVRLPFLPHPSNAATSTSNGIGIEMLPV